MNYLNIDNCYGPVLEVTDIYKQPNSEWVLIGDYKQFAFGLISQRQLTFQLDRIILPAEQWYTRLRCITVYQPDIPVNPIKFLIGQDVVGKIQMTDDYRNYSMMMFVSLIALFGLYVVLGVLFLIWSHNTEYPNRAQLIYLISGWPEDEDDEVREQDDPVVSATVVNAPPPPPPPPVKSKRTKPNKDTTDKTVQSKAKSNRVEKSDKKVTVSKQTDFVPAKPTTRETDTVTIKQQTPTTPVEPGAQVMIDTKREDSNSNSASITISPGDSKDSKDE